MTKILILLCLFIGIMTLSSCEEEAPSGFDPCADGDWGSVARNGEEICFPSSTALSYEANTSRAYFRLQLGDFGTPGAISLSARFEVPASGLELNKVYTLSSGDFYGIEELVSGEMTILTYEPVKDGNHCASGTFHMITKNPNSGSQTTLTNGKFLSQRGSYDCNPF